MFTIGRLYKKDYILKQFTDASIDYNMMSLGNKIIGGHFLVYIFGNTSTASFMLDGVMGNDYIYKCVYYFK